MITMATFLITSLASGQTDTAAVGKTVLAPFDYEGVSLRDKHFRLQFDEVRDFYLRLPNDDLLRGYRLRAGLPAPGKDLGGCYLGHNTFGQVLSGLARMYAATGDSACKHKAEALMQGWAECIDEDGFFFIVADPGLPPYYYDKMVCGLLDLYLYCGNREALDHLSRITDWAIENLDRARLYARPTGPGGGEWYTLSENLYRVYLATGDTKYRDFAEVWEYKEFWDLLADGSDIFQHHMNGGWYHAYSHVNSLNGLAAAYLAKGEQYYLDTLRKAYDFLWDTQLWATGGYGPNETLMPRPRLATMLKETSNHFETQCGSWAGFKICEYLITLTGDARYGDWMELLALNGIGASIPMAPDGSVFYYSEYHLGGSSKHTMAPWACCSGTRPQAVASFHDIICFHDSGNLYVNLFVSSSVEWACGDVNVRVDQDTQFPEQDVTQFAVHVDKPAEFGLNLRAPWWLTAPMTVTVNGEGVPVEVNEHHWVAVRREWQDGDRISVTLPMGWNLSRVLPEEAFPVALRWGPVVLAARSMDANPSPKFDFENIAGCLEAVPGDPLNFHLKADPDVLVRPFYDFKEGERYFMYLDPENALTRESYREAQFSPGWTDFGSWNATHTIGATVEYTFEGGSIGVCGQLYDDAGRFEAKVDGQVVGVIDQYGPNRGQQHRWDFTDLGRGLHTLTLTLLPEKAEESKGNWVNVQAFEVTRGD